MIKGIIVIILGTCFFCKNVYDGAKPENTLGDYAWVCLFGVIGAIALDVVGVLIVLGGD